MAIFFGIVSAILFLILCVVSTWLYQYFSRRKKLFEFFNVKITKKLVLYVSHLRIIPGGAIGINGKQRSFGESAVPLTEARLASLFQRLFVSAIPSLETLPGFLKRIAIADIDLKIEPSPLNEDTVEKDTTIIALGSPGYNIASKYIESSLHSLGKFTPQNDAVEIPGTSPWKDILVSFVQRAKNNSSGTIAFYAAGMSSIGTMGASHFLTSKWQDLQDKYGNDKPFCIILKISPEDHTQYRIICEKS